MYPKILNDSRNSTNSFNRLLCLLLIIFSSPRISSQIILKDNVSVAEEQFQIISSSQDLSREKIITINFSEDNPAQEFYYGKLELTNPLSSQNTQWVLSFSKIITEIEFYSASDPKFSKRSGAFLQPSLRSFYPSTNGSFLNVLVSPGNQETIYFKARCDRENVIPNFDHQIQTIESFYSKMTTAKQNQGLFFGFLMMILVYNLFLYFFSTRDIAYVYYSLYLAGIIIYTAYNTGDLADRIFAVFDPINPQFLFYAKTIVYPIIFFYLTFLRKFLDLKTLLPLWNKILNLLGILLLPAIILDVYLMLSSNFNYDLSDNVTVGTSLVFVVVAISFSLVLLPTKDLKGYFIIAGTFFMAVGASITIYSRSLSVDYSTLYFRIGVVLEVVIFSLGLAFRNRQAEKEKQTAVFNLEKNRILQEKEHSENLRLKEVDEFKDQFYTNITHEFRTPLTVIMGMNDEIKGHPKETTIIKRNSSQLLRLINQMLDLSKIESNKMQVKWVNREVVSFLGFLTESFYSYANSKNIRLTYYPENEEIWMDIDETMIEQIVYNLITNAIKFTPAKGKVILHVKQEQINNLPHLRLKVKDSGKGIKEEDLDAIFGRYYQNNGSELSEGTGIGLSLVKEIVNLLGGEIMVNSKVDSGSEFCIDLPIKNESSKLERDSIDQKAIFEYTNNEKLSESKKDPLKLDLALVEDNEDVAEYIKAILVRHYNVEVYADGEIGTAKILETIPDIVISDVMMPGKDGYQLAETIKLDSRTSHIPIILLTAKATHNDKLKGLSSGADDFLLKPFDKNELLLRLNNIQKRQEQIILNYQNSLNTKEFRSPNTKEVTRSHEGDFIDKLWQFIENNLKDSTVSKSALADHVGLSETQFYRKLKALTGQSAAQFIRSFRLKHAKSLLSESDLNISEIAYEVGFNDPSYFTRVFTKQFNTTPREILNSRKS